MVSDLNNPQQNSELNQLVDDIKAGKRVIVFPPGIAYFILVILLMVASVVTLFGPLLAIVGADWEIQQRAVSQLAIVVLAVSVIVFPAIQITRGKKYYQRWIVLFSSTLAFTAALLIVVGMVGKEQAILDQSAPLFLSIILASIATLLSQSARYRLLVDFYYLLRI